MTRTPLTKNKFYYDLFRYILKEEKVRSYHITKRFSNAESKKEKDNFSGKLQTLKKSKLIRQVGSGSRGRHGKYGIYAINYPGVLEYLWQNYLKKNKEVDYKNPLIIFRVMNSLKTILKHNKFTLHQAFTKLVFEEGLKEYNKSIIMKQNTLNKNFIFANIPDPYLKFIDEKNQDKLFTDYQLFCNALKHYLFSLND